MSESLIPDHDGDLVVDEREDVVPGGSKDYKCPWCPKVFSNSSTMKQHLGSMHSTNPDNMETKKKEGSGRLLCPSKSCDAMLASYDSFCRHCQEDHELELAYINERFDSEDEFKAWLDHLGTVSCRMVRRRGARTAADGTTMGDYHCIYDGKKRDTPSTRAPERTPYTRRVPSKKLGFACPANIRYQTQIDKSVIIKAQLQHFGHTVHPNQVMGRITHPSMKVMGRRKRRGYMHEDPTFDETDSHHDAHQYMNGDEIEVDDEGMVNLFTLSPLEQARFHAHRACTSMDLAFQEVQSIPHENVQHIGHLINKFHEISSAATTIEALLKQLSVPTNLTYHPRIGEIPPTRKIMEARLRLNQKRHLSATVKEDHEEDEKQSILEANGATDEERFEQQSEHGEVVYHDDTVAEEVIVDGDEADYDEERRERKDKNIKKMHHKRL